MLTPQKSFAAQRDAFAWDIPGDYAIAWDTCEKWAQAEPDRIAMVLVDEARDVTYRELSDASARLAGLLAARGVGRGDRVGVLLPQRYETALAHLAALRLGAVSIPLFSLFGADALTHRMRDSGAVAVITDAGGAAKLAALRDALPDLHTVLSCDGPQPGAEDMHALLPDAEPAPLAELGAEDPAFLIYTSGTTGNPKGALHAQRVLLGHLPGVEISHDFLGQEGDRIWTPADWAWIGGLLDVLFPALALGVPVVTKRFDKFTGEAAFELMREHRVRNAFLPPTALKMMYRVPDAESYGLRLRSVASGGEPLGAELIGWGQRVFGATINEFYGQTECNMIVSSCAALEPATPGTMGRAVPGHDVRVLSPGGEERAPGQEGAICVASPDPVMFLGYWNNPQATEEKFLTDPQGRRWLVTGDRGVLDDDGKIRFLGRDDDIISSAGYRIGPGEVEDCLLTHPAIAMAGVVGKPDALRGHVVAAYVTLAPGFAASDTLADEIALHVKTRLAAHEYPRVIRFIEEMPMTTTGKIVRRTLRQMAEAEA
ncbi:MAG: AMP-dependent synthetase [Rhodobacterales bacterium]|nr:MAG: AMP-dependent synthetase [Rhodobacterales bacterium]